MEHKDHHVRDAGSSDLIDQEQRRLDDSTHVKEEHQEPVEEYVVSRFTPYVVVSKREACDKIQLGLCYRVQQKPVRRFYSGFKRASGRYPQQQSRNASRHIYYNCNKKGHYARDCFAEKMVCYNCGQQGHCKS